MNCKEYIKQKKRNCQCKPFKDGLCKRHYNKNKNNEDCFICLESKKLEVLSCGHSLCSSCLIKTASYSCPFCRKNISGELSSDIVSLIQYIQLKDKQIGQLNNYIYVYQNQINEYVTYINNLNRRQ